MAFLTGYEELSIKRNSNTAATAEPLELTITDGLFRFSRGVARVLGFPAYVKFMVNPRGKRFIVMPAQKGEPNAVRFSKPSDRQGASIPVRLPAVVETLAPLFPLGEAGEGEDANSRVNGVFYRKELAVAFLAKDAVPGAQKHRGRRKAAPAEAAGERPAGE